MKNKALIETIIEEINGFNENELIDLNNAYCDHINSMDNYIYSNDEDFFNFLDWNGLRVAQAIFYGDYNYSHDYVTFDGYGNFQTYGIINKDKLADCVETMAEYIADNCEDFQYLFNIDLESLKD
jgi:hypothetical protein